LLSAEREKEAERKREVDFGAIEVVPRKERSTKREDCILELIIQNERSTSFDGKAPRRSQLDLGSDGWRE
jgi:hypothetical protein